ncbi:MULTISPECIES: SpoIIE family protein phosphatase [Streptomyces]
MAQLARALRHHGQSLETLCDSVLRELLPSPAQDDVALLMARPRGEPG